MMKGWKTLAFNGGAAVGMAALTWAGGVNWTDYVSPTAAMMIVFAVNGALRFLTTGPVGRA